MILNSLTQLFRFNHWILSGILSCATSIQFIKSKSLPPEKSSVKCRLSDQILFPLGIIRFVLPLLVIWLGDTNQFCCVSSGLAWIQKCSHVQLKRNHGRNPFINPVLWGNTGNGKTPAVSSLLIIALFRHLCTQSVPLPPAPTSLLC